MSWKFTGGRPETKCGAGSLVINTEGIRLWLPKLFRAHGIRSLLDVPCGDFNWMSRTDLSHIDYIGADSDAEHLGTAMLKGSEPIEFSPRSKHLMRMDLTVDPIPYADCIMCRDFLQHLPTHQARNVLDRLLGSKARYLLMTSHLNEFNDDIAQGGQFRPLNLRIAPFNLPRPVTFAEDNGRVLGLWHR